MKTNNLIKFENTPYLPFNNMFFLAKNIIKHNANNENLEYFKKFMSGVFDNLFNKIQVSQLDKNEKFLEKKEFVEVQKYAKLLSNAISDLQVNDLKNCKDIYKLIPEFYDYKFPITKGMGIYINNMMYIDFIDSLLDLEKFIKLTFDNYIKTEVSAVHIFILYKYYVAEIIIYNKKYNCYFIVIEDIEYRANNIIELYKIIYLIFKLNEKK